MSPRLSSVQNKISSMRRLGKQDALGRDRDRWMLPKSFHHTSVSHGIEICTNHDCRIQFQTPKTWRPMPRSHESWGFGLLISTIALPWVWASSPPGFEALCIKMLSNSTNGSWVFAPRPTRTTAWLLLLLILSIGMLSSPENALWLARSPQRGGKRGNLVV